MCQLEGVSWLVRATVPRWTVPSLSEGTISTLSRNTRGLYSKTVYILSINLFYFIFSKFFLQSFLLPFFLLIISGMRRGTPISLLTFHLAFVWRKVTMLSLASAGTLFFKFVCLVWVSSLSGYLTYLVVDFLVCYIFCPSWIWGYICILFLPDHIMIIEYRLVYSSSSYNS